MSLKFRFVNSTECFEKKLKNRTQIMDIRKKMAKGAFWLFLEKGAQQISSFVVFAVIVRMIGPEEYGLVALCGIVLALINNITFGLADSIINMKIRDDERLSSLFWFVLGVGAFLSVLSFFLAEPFAAFFYQEKLVLLMQAFAVIPFLCALAAVPIALITATMDFRVFTLRTFVASLVGGGAGVYLAYNGWGAFALATQQIIAQCITILILFISSPWRPRLIFKTTALKEMIGLGVGQTGSLFVSFVEQQTPRLVLGYFIGPVAVGYYAFVRRIIGVLQDGIIQPVLRVVYPAISEIIDNTEEKKKVIEQIVFVLGATIFPIVAGLILTAPLFIPLLFGEEWRESVALLQILAPALFFISFNVFLISILRAHRQVFKCVKLQMMIAVLSIGGYVVFANISTAAVLTVTVIASCVGSVALSILMKRVLDISIARYVLSLGSPLAASVVMFIVAVFIMRLSEPSGIEGLLMIIGSGVVSYFIVLTILERKRLKRYINV